MKRILIANRGEIAVRIARSVREAGLTSIAVYADPDRHSPHVAACDEAYRIGQASLQESYLSSAAILAAAERANADAIHPGYGFLSENADFAEAVEAAGMTWIGPPPGAIRAMGDKSEAKQLMRAAGVPCVPGAEGSPEELLASELKYPVLVKASAGGGGRGMRRVDRPEDLASALETAASEATRSFGRGDLLVEHLVLGARHVEVQVLADQHGNTLHLGERDCSVQRRHQKVVEEAPSPAVDPALRAAMGAAAVRAAQAVDYVGAGTVEFLLAADGSFYFLEMNTRLQVEHPVTELVYGLDLVHWQLEVARGLPLPWRQHDLAPEGHAIEVRLYAEDPSQGYRPSTGPVVAVEWPQGIRVDAGVGPEITPLYDPMLAKLIARGRTRADAIARLRQALRDMVWAGPVTNRAQLAAILDHPAFQAGEATTSFLSEFDVTGLGEPSAEDIALAVAQWLPPPTLPFSNRSTPLQVNGVSRVLPLSWRGHWTVDGVSVRGNEVDGRVTNVSVTPDGGGYWVHLPDRTLHIGPDRVIPEQAAGDAQLTLTAPMACTVLRISCREGDLVEAGQALGAVEAMKLETPLRAEVAGRVAEIAVQEGQSVRNGALLIRLEAAE